MATIMGLGSPGTQLTTVRPDTKYADIAVVSQIFSGLSSASDALKGAQAADDERKARVDIMNKNVSPDLRFSSAVYNGMVVDAELGDRFNEYKSGINEEKYSDMEPEDFQKMLDERRATDIKSLSQFPYSDVHQESMAKFWAEKEPVLVAAQRAKRYQRVQQGQEYALAHSMGAALTTDLDESNMGNVLDAILAKAGNAIPPEKQLQTALAIASNHALNGNNTLLKILNDKYKVSAVPELAPSYRAASKAYAQAKIAADQQYIVDQKTNYSMLAEEGVFGRQHVAQALGDARLKDSVTDEWLTGLMLKSAKQNLIKRNLDQAYIRIGKGQDIGYLPHKDLNTVFDQVISSVNAESADPVYRAQKTAYYLKNQTTMPDSMKRETKAFSIAAPVMPDGTPNPDLKQAYTYFSEMEKTQGFTPGQFSTMFEDADLKNYYTLKSYMSSLGGDFDSRFKFAAGKLNDISQMSTSLSQDVVRLQSEKVDQIADDKISSASPWWKLGELDADDSYKRSVYKSNIINIAKSEIRRGLNPEAALEYAQALTDRNWEHSFGQLQQTGGVPIDARAGFTQKGQAEAAYEFVMAKDPEVKAALTKVYGEGYKVKDLKTVLNGNMLQIGGDKEQAFYISLETMAQKYRTAMSLNASMQKLTGPGSDYSNSVLNDQFATRLSIMDTDTTGRGPQTYNKLRSSLKGLTLDKYLSLPPDQQTAERQRVEKAVGSIVMTSSVVIPDNNLGRRNNNPGNLRYAGQAGAKPGEGGFAMFDTLEDGYNALKKQINLDGLRNHTLRSFVYKYAPASDGNNPIKYLNDVINGLNLKQTESPIEWLNKKITPDTPLKDISIESMAQTISNLETGAR